MCWDNSKVEIRPSLYRIPDAYIGIYQYMVARFLNIQRDRARAAPLLVAELMEQGRRVFLIKNLFDWKVRSGLVDMYGVAGFRSGVIDLLELGGRRVEGRNAR